MISTKDIEKAKKILDYWYTMEFLAQDKYDSMWDVRKRVREAKNTYQYKKKSPRSLWNYIEFRQPVDLYGEISSQAASCGMKKWGNITVYIGKIPREACIESIASVLSDSSDEKRHDRSYDEIAWASIQLAPDGTYIEHSLSLSTVIWAMSQIKNCSGRLSENIDEKKYTQAVEELEQSFFKREPGADEAENVLNDGETDSGIGQMQKFSSEAVTAEKLHALFAAIEKKYVKDNITSPAAVRSEQGEMSAESEDDAEDGNAGEIYKENYGLHFQMFQDENAKRTQEDDSYIGLSHAYFLTDIRHILQIVNEGGELSEDLLHYINILGNESEYQPVRIDLVHPKKQERESFFQSVSDILQVKNAPLGKWPSRYMPAFMQQIAVNLGTGKGQSKLFEINGNVFSVNGPPGTGKTTLLKEIVAGNIIERAKLLAEYDHPDDAFERHSFLCGEGKGGSYYKYVRYWNSLKNDRINDYGILVASCNNAAVENVTKELPIGAGIRGTLQPASGDTEEHRSMLSEVSALFDPEQAEDQETIGGQWKKDIYFTEYARNLLNNEDAWGLAAAPLGKRSNLADFYYNVLLPLHKDFYWSNSDIEERLVKYTAAKKAFQAQLEKVQGMQNELQGICDLARERNALRAKDALLQEEKTRHQAEYEAQESGFEAEKTRQDSKLARLDEEIRSALDAKEQISEQVREAQSRAEELPSKKIEWLEKENEVRDSVGFFGRLFHSAKSAAKSQLADEYHREAEKAGIEYEQALGDLEEIRGKLSRSEQIYNGKIQEKNRVESEIRRQEDKLRELGVKLKELERQAEDSAQRLREMEALYRDTVNAFTGMGAVDSGAVLDENLINDLLCADEKASVRAQVTDPWFTERYNREREKLFYRAMKLNKEFVLSSKRCRDNLITLSQYWGMKPDENNERITFDRKDREAFAPALYQTLFLLVPVLSSTFASIGTFLKDIKEPGALGTLIVDEAGQAQPQMALGTLFRCRRAVIVGDPKQVEPVVTDDLRFLKKSFDDKELKLYQSKSISVQSFADSLNGFGTYLDNGTDEPEWVGCPLLVHRRCISPMYDISNEISYGGIMKQQTLKPNKEKENRFIYDRSQWINVIGKEKGRKDHFVEAQGRKVCEMLEKAFSVTAAPDLYIISPFTSVVYGIKQYIRNYKKHHGSLAECGEEWMGGHIGTVHTFQGKEAAEVIFLLGCDESRDALGAVKWVNANIVNVAATRAKYRLYVIGDEAAWKNSEVVSRAKAIIDTFAIRQIKAIMEQELTEEKRREALAEASAALPPATSFGTEMPGSKSGETDYSIDTDGLLGALGEQFMEEELTKEQMMSFGFQSPDELNRLPAQIRDNIRLGIRLYFLLRTVYEVNANLDASCCSILFCKAIELQMKECFGSTLQKAFPDYAISGKTLLKNVQISKLTLGNFDRIIKGRCQELARRMEEKGESNYNFQWWRQYQIRLNKCTNRRNLCCHSGLFTWDDQAALITEIFLEEKAKEGSGECGTAMRGLLFEAEVGRKI